MMFTKISLFLLPLGPGLASAGLLPSWLSPRTTAMCDVEGYADTDNNYFWSASKKLATYSGCSARCAADDRCESFGFDDRVCMLFDEPLTGNFEEDKHSDLVYYDSSCVNATTTATTSSTGTTAVPTVTAFLTASTTADAETTSETDSSDAAATTIEDDSAEDAATTTDSAAATTTDDSAAATTTDDSDATTTTDETAATTTSGGDVDGSPVIVPDSTTTATSDSSVSTGTSTTTTSSVAVPAGCDIPATYTITSFTWFNSSSNLDCVNHNYANGSQVCWNASTMQLCDSATAQADNCTCGAYCSAGMPTAAYQPAGFGPADTISVAFSGVNGTCKQSNPSATRAANATRAADEVGDGSVDCGSSVTDILNFYGDSTRNGTVGSFDFYPPAVTCNGQAATYGANFTLQCARDAGGNATCTTTMPLTLSLTGFSS